MLPVVLLSQLLLLSTASDRLSHPLKLLLPQVIDVAKLSSLLLLLEMISAPRDELEASLGALFHRSAVTSALTTANDEPDDTDEEDDDDDEDNDDRVVLATPGNSHTETSAS
jgi:hypothetical protein